MSSLAIKLLLLLFLWYSLICLSFGVPSGYSILNQDLEKFNSEKEIFHPFQMWKEETEREYKTLEEEVMRFQVFKRNLQSIKEENAKRKSPYEYRLGLNKFSDMSYEEFRKIYLHEIEELIMGSHNSKMVLNDAACPNAPSSWDWRTKGAVTYVKDQGKCGSCWAFSATGAIEGINKIVKQWLPVLFEQQLISCDKNDKGCDGGWYSNAFQYVINNRGIASEGDYPYKAKDSACFSHWNKRNLLLLIAIIIGFTRLYLKGIFNGNDCSRIGSCKHNHAVLIVGYGSTSDDQDHWIVKNSWGPSWGQRGYIFIKRNSGAAHGVCNINCSGAYPIKGNKETPVLKLAASI
ncbi:ervatamin-B-like [Neltuma alba]|uniref:ervatamin-B-like n=1 Tax=Neltuma alba TaxID=207710 RepID=UPI0010A3D02E|nr:ervatamin-B-like [Prosopis alba]